MSTIMAYSYMYMMRFDMFTPVIVSFLPSLFNPLPQLFSTLISSCVRELEEFPYSFFQGQSLEFGGTWVFSSDSPQKKCSSLFHRGI